MQFIIVFPCKGVLGPGAFAIVARERFFFAGVDRLVMALESSSPTEDMLLAMTSRVLAGKLVLIVTPLRKYKYRKILLGVKLTLADLDIP